MTHKTGLFVGMAAICFIFVIVAVIALCSSRKQEDSEEAHWCGNKLARLAIARFLADKKMLEGRTGEDVIALLGKPDKREPGKNSSQYSMFWFLGSFESASLMFPHERYLEVYFSGHKVIGAVTIDLE